MKRAPGAGRKRTKPPFSEFAVKLGAAITKRRLFLGLSLPDVEKRLNMSHQAISNIESGQTNPDDKRTRRTLARLAQEFKDDFGLSWLIPDSKEREREIPILGSVAAGQPLELYETEDEKFTIDTSFIRASGPLMILKVKGESMLANHILTGDLLICRREAKPRKHAITVVELKGERGSTVKRWERDGDDITLCADFDDPDSPRQNVKAYFVGKAFEVVGLFRIVK